MQHTALLEVIYKHLEKIYTGSTLPYAKEIFTAYIDSLAATSFKQPNPLTENNVYLITYGDSFLQNGQPPLLTLHAILQKTLADSITDVHLLPMFPYTSDDGFSVVDYLEINPELGSWNDIYTLEKDFRLMFDFVANHTSKSSLLFLNFLDNKPGFEDFYTKENKNFDTKNVVRPRTSPLYHTYTNSKGEQIRAWSTFSEDQVDVNAQNPAMLLYLTKVLVEYIHRGASSIRLDAIGFLWKESGTTCMSLPQTHEIIKLWRSLISFFCPHVQIITETNVPHQENISYFGSGNDEASQVYQFSLPPLTLFAFTVGNASVLLDWAEQIETVSETGTFFNFLASHDGIGMRPTEGILSQDEKEMLVQKVIENGGFVSYKQNTDGTKSVYELNINYGDALRNQGENDSITIQKIIAAHHILFSLIGVPAIYYHSIFGSRGDRQSVETSGINRRINREKLEYSTLLQELEHSSYRKNIFSGIKTLLQLRKKESAFNPYACQKVLRCNPHIFAVRRYNSVTNETIDCYTNVSGEAISIAIQGGTDIITNTELSSELHLAPYGCAWVKHLS